MQIAFVTCAKFPELTDDDQLLVHYLSTKNIIATPVRWDDTSIDWQGFHAIVFRSMWDYFERPAEFDQWLDKLEALDCNTMNPISVARWNQDKTYFDDFSSKGILLPAYIICSKEQPITLKDILLNKGWGKAVVKPAISGGAYNTWVTTIDDAAKNETRFTELLQNGDVIVQVFVEEIISNGELSLIFFNKKFSHAICKRAKQGDFRVQAQFGGTAKAIEPSKTILAEATQLLNSIEEPLLYARVDGVIANDGKFLLMELELIEPTLSVSVDDKACENFYHAFLDILTSANKMGSTVDDVLMEG